MTSAREALTTHLDHAIAMRDDDAVRVLRSTLAALPERHNGDHSDADRIIRNTPNETNTDGQDTDADLATLRQAIDARSRAAGQVASANPEAAAALRREAEILTIVLASAGH